jgi:uncharacterized protein (UPF0264 family)
LDTCDKGAASLFDQCTDREVAEWIDEGRRSGMRVVIAGSLTFQTAARAAALGPDYIAVRGAACRGGRSGELDAGRIAGLRSRLAHSSVVRSQSSHERATIR